MMMEDEGGGGGGGGGLNGHGDMECDDGGLWGDVGGDDWGEKEGETMAISETPPAAAATAAEAAVVMEEEEPKVDPELVV